VGHFTQLNDDDAELLTGGAKPANNPSTAYNGSNYGQYLKTGGTTEPNPGGRLGRNK
jgi:hypothetical protein